jgi:hypothetical protein
VSTHRPVRLTYDAAWLARWILGRHGTLTRELVEREAPEFGAGARTVGVLIDALQRTGEHGVRALSHYEEQT